MGASNGPLDNADPTKAPLRSPLTINIVDYLENPTNETVHGCDVSAISRSVQANSFRCRIPPALLPGLTMVTANGFSRSMESTVLAGRIDSQI